MKKIAIPVVDNQLSPHFGHCQTFAVFEVDENQKSILSTTHHTPPPHEPGVLPQWLHELGTNIIIAGGMGQRAQTLFQQNNIDVVVGAPAENPENIIQKYLKGLLQTSGNLCDH